MKKYLDYRSECMKDKSVKTWIKLYKHFQNIEQSLVRIQSFDQDELCFEMEDIQGFCLNDNERIAQLTRKQKRDIISQVICLWGKMQTWTVPTDMNYIFMHRDFCINNLMYDEFNSIVKLVDPDSFAITPPALDNPIYHGPFIDTLYIMRLWERL